MTFAIFKSSGTTPCSNERLNKYNKGATKVEQFSFTSRGLMLSGPQGFFSFSDTIKLINSGSVTGKIRNKIRDL